MIERIVYLRADGNQAVEHLTRAKLIIKGVDPGKFDDSSPDDPAVIRILETVAGELGLAL